jgi:hypothetical protein
MVPDSVLEFFGADDRSLKQSNEVWARVCLSPTKREVSKVTLRGKQSDTKTSFAQRVL